MGRSIFSGREVGKSMDMKRFVPPFIGLLAVITLVLSLVNALTAPSSPPDAGVKVNDFDYYQFKQKVESVQESYSDFKSKSSQDFNRASNSQVPDLRNSITLIRTNLNELKQLSQSVFPLPEKIDETLLSLTEFEKLILNSQPGSSEKLKPSNFSNQSSSPIQKLDNLIQKLDSLLILIQLKLLELDLLEQEKLFKTQFAQANTSRTIVSLVTLTISCLALALSIWVSRRFTKRERLKTPRQVEPSAPLNPPLPNPQDYISRQELGSVQNAHYELASKVKQIFIKLEQAEISLKQLQHQALASYSPKATQPSSVNPLAQVVDSPVLSSLLSLSKLLQLYNSRNRGDLSQVIIARLSEATESIDRRRLNSSHPITLESQPKGNYWVLEGEGSKYWLVPRDNLKIDEFVYQTVQALFECRDYQQGSTGMFEMIAPAEVVPTDNSRQMWKLEKFGRIQFTSRHFE